MPKRAESVVAGDEASAADSADSSSPAVENKKQKLADGEDKVLRNEDGEPYYNIAAKRRITVRKWKTGTLIDIREYWQDPKDGKDKPGKKGMHV